ncbi:spore coat protein CotH [Streptomyces sp. MMG1522]|uniref:CotH kinase family protein n=1 Tax=Streptomyces sp. MMG1522 TaxID=1415545 RepID=UPI0006ADCC60|nr:CotH kinase family protein [Streptomyces sp. MMG1522]KOU46934.1 spore coat protein CotH [Streptomyces sp. MMG1522]
MTGDDQDPVVAPVRRRRLKDRLPVRLRHHWKPAGALCVGLAVAVYFFGDTRVSPYVTSASRVEADTVTDDVKGTVDLYDASVAHQIQLTYKQTDFNKMVKEFEDEGTKDYISADLTIDGVYLENVGIRLKGNSTLMSLRGDGKGMPGGGRNMPPGAGAQQGDPPAAHQGAGGGRDRGQNTGGGPGTTQQQPGQTAQGGPTGNPPATAGPDGAGGAAAGGQKSSGGSATGQQKATGGATGGQGGTGDNAAGGPGAAGGGPGGMVQYDLSAKKPEELPWLIKIDEYIEGRAYQGEREISLRPGANEQVPLNEALSLSLTESSGQPAEAYSFTSVQVNNRPAVTRLMVDNPDTEYAEAVGDGNGVLYKARAGGSFAYRGDDPSEYKSSFRQLNKVGSQDLSPVMRLIKWADEASDKEFEEELDQYVDVDSLAAYIATQNLLLNFDDISGPGKNYMLYYDLDTKKFSVLGWDYNLTFSGDTAAGPDDKVSIGGGRGRGGEGQQNGEGAAGQPEGGMPDLPEGMPEPPEGMELPEGVELPDGMEPPEGMPGGGNGEPGGRGGSMGGNALKDRFLESDAFDAVYKAAYKKVYAKTFASDTAVKALDTIADQAREAAGSSKELDAAVEKLRTTVTERTTALAKNKQVTG